MYESIMIALSVAFGGKSGSSDKVKATTPEQLQAEMQALFTP